MSDINCVNEKKCMRKQKRAQHRIARDMNIKCCDESTENLVICNAGLVTGFKREELENILNEITKKYTIIMPPGKSYCFLKFDDKIVAEKVYQKFHGRNVDGQVTPIYLTFSQSTPDIEEEVTTTEFPNGLELIEEFITIEEESRLLNSINWDNNCDVSSELKHRNVKHFGYEFRYDINTVDPDQPIAPIPDDYKFLLDLFQKNNCGNHNYDQLTINRYLPGQGIPPHIDTHSAFEDSILSLSIGSECVMDFRKDNKKVSLHLPARSLLIMSGESRYSWTHGICPRQSDVIKIDNGITVKERGIRTSFTFRKVRRGDCECKFYEYCNSKRNEQMIDEVLAPGLELSYVHDVYEEISRIFKIGLDRSTGLSEICKKKSFEILLSDCLQLPFKTNSVDAIISIAVIHHLSTHERRQNAFLELLRVLRPGGRCLVYVWAKEQERNSKKSTYLRSNTTSNDSGINARDYQKLYNGLMLPIHENRTNFIHNDVLVPWKRKGGGEFFRYYHFLGDHRNENDATDMR
ncbi:hypothetical protein PV327_006651 [Microctonus hyperodae]|uniref:Fe2OG dioxygenase domain-containing protein n=1 Tax=Microctonus hyperodae TaxID=165561 RepID=A0AA39KIJ1_MICHY|nr:hypothetical protein PV327_006651 [Microctonus hyperodae]